jgi:hypothetical protein
MQELKPETLGRKLISKIKLTEWVLGGEHEPEVEVWMDESSQVVYQPHRKTNLMRKTDPKDWQTAGRYGDWIEAKF